MGREWYQWGVKSSKNRARVGNKTSAAANPPPPEAVAAAAAATGCMTVVSQLFDFHHLQFCLHHPSNSSSDDPSSIKGVEAPRNSLETEEVNRVASLASVSETEQEGDDNLCDNMNIPMGIQITTARRDTKLLRPKSPSPKTGNANYFSISEPENSNTPVNSSRRDTKLLRVRAPKLKTGEEQKNSGFTSESSISPALPRTPTLVARLMGLDLLPEGYPSSSSCTPRSSTKKQSPRISSYDFAGSFSEPPRASTGGRRSDAEGYNYSNRRLSLQINKENRGGREGEDLVELSRHSCSEINTKRRDVNAIDEDSMISRSPSYYAKQIMKQVKETVMKRRFGADITNKTGELQNREQRKVKRPQNDVVKETPSPELVSAVAKKEITEPVQVVIMKPEQRQVTNKGNANPSAKRISRMNKKEEQFVRAGVVGTTRAGQGLEKKCKTTPLSSELVVQSLVPLKKSDPSIGSHRKAPVFQEQVSKKPKTVTYSNPAPESQPARCGPAITGPTRSEFNYINQVLKRAGINRETPVSFTRWFSGSHPLDPTLFQRIEAGDALEELRPACNRRLMFELVDEILAEIMRPEKAGRDRGGVRGWDRVHGFQVMRMVWTRVKGFPRADCRILQDIDELVEMDLSGPGSGSGTGFGAGEEEEDDIVAEIEREIVEALVVDTAVAVGVRWR